MPRPTLFVGSSTEGLRIAQAIQVLLDPVCEVSLWSQGVFGLTQGTLESLVTNLPDFDFAVLVLTADDLNISRGMTKAAARDNVLFKLGLFIGSLGRDRTFIVYNRADPPDLPTDLAGVTPATFIPHESGNLVAALGAACTRIQNVIERLGTRRPQENTPAGQLTRPRGGRVNRSERVTGVVSCLPPHSQALILVQTQHHYWLQAKLWLNQEDGGFTSEAKFGRVGNQDSGKEYILLLVAAPPAVAASFQSSLEDDNGISFLPPDVLVLDKVTVIRS